MAGTDEDEFALLSRLALEPLGSYAAWAGALGWTVSTVRRRVLDLRARGVFEGFVALPEPETFGLSALGMAFYTTDPAPWEEVLAVPRVVSVASIIDDCQYVVAYGDPSGLQETRAALVDRLGVVPGKEVRPARRDGLGPDRFGRLDWRVMRAFLDEPRASLKELAAATGLTPRTAGARRDALIEAGAMAAWPLLRTGRSGGPLYFHLTVWGDDMDVIRAATARHVRHTVVSEGAEPPMMYTFCQAEDLMAQQRAVRALQAEPGVSDVRLVLTLSYHVAMDHVRGLVDAEIRRWEAARRA